jgi:hypothetical protein
VDITQQSPTPQFPVQPTPQPVLTPDLMIRYPAVGKDLIAFAYGWHTSGPRYPVVQGQFTQRTPIPHTMNTRYSMMMRARENRDKYISSQRAARAVQPQPQERSSNPLDHPFFNQFAPAVFSGNPLPAWARW